MQLKVYYLGLVSSDSKCSTPALIGKGIVMPKDCYTHMSVEEHETLSLGLAQGQSVWTMATGIEAGLQHREPRTRGQRAGLPETQVFKTR